MNLEFKDGHANLNKFARICDVRKVEKHSFFKLEKNGISILKKLGILDKENTLKTGFRYSWAAIGKYLRILFILSNKISTPLWNRLLFAASVFFLIRG